MGYSEYIMLNSTSGSSVLCCASSGSGVSSSRMISSSCMQVLAVGPAPLLGIDVDGRNCEQSVCTWRQDGSL
jgi:hypothetical protein